MKILSRNLIYAQLVWLIFCPVIFFGAQGNTSEHQRNISDCRNGWGTCDRSQLSDTEATALAAEWQEKRAAPLQFGTI